MIWLVLLSQIALPDPPKTTDWSVWFSWAVGALSLIIAAVLSYLVLAVKEGNRTANNATDQMVMVFKTMIEKLESQQKEERAEHEKDRQVFIEHSEKMKDAIVEVNKTQLLMTHELCNLKDAVQRSNGGGQK